MASKKQYKLIDYIKSIGKCGYRNESNYYEVRDNILYNVSRSSGYATISTMYTHGKLALDTVLFDHDIIHQYSAIKPNDIPEEFVVYNEVDIDIPWLEQYLRDRCQENRNG